MFKGYSIERKKQKGISVFCFWEKGIDSHVWKGWKEGMNKVFICSPYRGDVENNRKKAAEYSRLAYDSGCLPVAPHLLFPQFLDEDDPKERAAGIAMGLELLLDCDEVWVFGKATEGMEQEIRFAVEHGKHVWFKEL